MQAKSTIPKTRAIASVGTLAMLAVALSSLTGCPGPGLTVSLSGCPDAVINAGETVSLTATVTDAEGMDVTDSSVILAAVTGATFQVAAIVNGNVIEIPLPATAPLGTININVTASAGGSMASGDSCAVMIQPLTCPKGESCDDDDACTEDDTCVAGECVGTPIACPAGQSCVEGECVPDDPCEGVMCPTGETCVDGECVTTDPCDGVMCPAGEACIDGVCVVEDPCETGGDAAAGMDFYTSNGCAGCHGADGQGGLGPNLIGVSCDVLFDNISGVDPHPVVVEGSTRQDAADMKAYLDSL